MVEPGHELTSLDEGTCVSPVICSSTTSCNFSESPPQAPPGAEAPTSVATSTCLGKSPVVKITCPWCAAGYDTFRGKPASTAKLKQEVDLKPGLFLHPPRQRFQQGAAHRTVCHRWRKAAPHPAPPNWKEDSRHNISNGQCGVGTYSLVEGYHSQGQVMLRLPA